MEKVRDLDTFFKRLLRMIIEDLNKRKYLIKDVKKFISHIRKFHASGESLHEENGYFFLINDDFRKLIYDSRHPS